MKVKCLQQLTFDRFSSTVFHQVPPSTLCTGWHEVPGRMNSYTQFLSSPPAASLSRCRHQPQAFSSGLLSGDSRQLSRERPPMLQEMKARVPTADIESSRSCALKTSRPFLLSAMLLFTQGLALYRMTLKQAVECGKPTTLLHALRSASLLFLYLQCLQIFYLVFGKHVLLVFKLQSFIIILILWTPKWNWHHYFNFREYKFRKKYIHYHVKI